LSSRSCQAASNTEWTADNTLTVSATNATYTVPQNWYPVWAGMLYEADMVGLVTGKKQYRYRVGGLDDAGSAHRSQDFLFSSAPDVDADQKTVVATLGDQGTFMFLGFTTAHKLIEIQAELGVDAVHYAGDLSYAACAQTSHPTTASTKTTSSDTFGTYGAPRANPLRPRGL
jgi:hypothetical protein